MDIWEQFRWAVTVKGNLPNEPNDAQLAEIARQIRQMILRGVTPLDSDWDAVIVDVVRPNGMVKRGGMDYSDINAIFRNLLAKAQSQSKR